MLIMQSMNFDLLAAAAAIGDWGNTLWNYLMPVLGFSLVIFVHELGHFLAAKWAGVRVERFAIGFGKELFGFTKGETRYSFNLLPLGGYVKMLGQEDFVVDKSGELKVKEDPRSFTNKSIGQRMVIVSAGVIMNLIFAAIAFAIVVMVGLPQVPAIVGDVEPNTPASRAGLQTGDRIVAVNGRTIHTFDEFQAAVVLCDVDEPLELEVLRDGNPLQPPPRVTPEYKKDRSVRQVGLGPGRNRIVISASFCQFDTDSAHELKTGDELHKLVLNGEPKEFKDLGVFSRALVAARGKPVTAIVRRPKSPVTLSAENPPEYGPEVETTEMPISIQAVWCPVAYENGDNNTGSLLGMVPRLTILHTLPGKSFDKAGAEAGDVIVKINNDSYPRYDLVKRGIQESAGKPVSLEIRRSRAANRGLSADAVQMFVERREDLIAAAKSDLTKAVEMVRSLVEKAKVSQSDQKAINEKLAELKDAPAWRRWLEEVDVHKLAPLTPKGGFALFGTSPPPPIDALVRTIDEDHLVVADVAEKLGDRESPAHAAGIPAGAVILAVNKEPVKHWYQLAEALRVNSGKTVEISYRVSDEFKTTGMNVPVSISASLNLGAGTRIAKIDGRDSAVITGNDGKATTVSLPDWNAVRELLRNSVGKAVKVEYSTIESQPGSGTYQVTADNVDPWLMRMDYQVLFASRYISERHPISNPFLAAGEGFRQAYMKTMQAVYSIKHMVFTRQVGLDKVSGPVGIFRVASQFAESGPLDLLWFLAVISANLAVLNFLPMPIVDGGLFLFLVLEKIRGEPVSIKTQVATQLIGIALIAAVFILVTYQDIKNWIIGA